MNRELVSRLLRCRGNDAMFMPPRDFLQGLGQEIEEDRRLVVAAHGRDELAVGREHDVERVRRLLGQVKLTLLVLLGQLLRAGRRVSEPIGTQSV